jgi:hypothetical protein
MHFTPSNDRARAFAADGFGMGLKTNKKGFFK